MGKTPRPKKRRPFSVKFRSVWVRLPIILALAVLLVGVVLVAFAVVSRRVTSAKGDASLPPASPAARDEAPPVSGDQPEAETPQDELELVLAKGREALAEGNAGQAIMFFRNACAQKPDTATNWLLLVLACRQAGEFNQAWQNCERGLALATDDRADLYRVFAHLAEDCGQPTMALEQATALLRLLPDDVDAHLIAANSLLLLGRSAPALEHARAASQLDPKSHSARVALGRALVAEDQFEEAVAILRQELAEYPGSPDASLALAHAQRRLGDEAGAQETLDAVSFEGDQVKGRLIEVRLDKGADPAGGIAGSPQAIAAMVAAEKAELMLVRGHPQEAIAQYEKLAAEQPALHSIHYRLAELKLQTGQAEAARTLAAAHLVQYPQDKGSRVILARVFLTQRLPGLAEDECRKVLADATGDPQELAARKLLAISLNRSGDPRRAADEMRLYLEKRPNDLDAVMRQGVFLTASQGAAVGLALLREARERFPGDPQLAAQESLLLQQSGDAEAAIAATEKAFELGAEGAVGHLRLSAMLLDQKRFEEALVQARLAYDLAPRSHLAASNLAWCLIMSDKLDEALPHLQEALVALPTAPRYRYQYAVYLHRKGLDGEAKEALRVALASPRKFRERKDAEELLASLGGTEP